MLKVKNLYCSICKYCKINFTIDMVTYGAIVCI